MKGTRCLGGGEHRLSGGGAGHSGSGRVAAAGGEVGAGRELVLSCRKSRLTDIQSLDSLRKLIKYLLIGLLLSIVKEARKYGNSFGRSARFHRVAFSS